MDGPIAEYVTHKGTIALYPVRNDIWRENARHMQKYMCSLVETISKFEPVYFFCKEPYAESLENQFKQNINVIIIRAEYDDIWARDISPTFIRVHNKVECIDWKFNAWGGRKEGSYSPWDNDDAFASVVAGVLGLKSNRASLVVEGGGIITDGDGTVFTTQSVLLNRNRNPFKAKEAVQEYLKKTIGASRVVWLKQGLASDETNGHIDNVLACISSNEICLAWTDDKSNPNYARVRRIEDDLKGLKNLSGMPYTVYRIPLPSQQYMTEEESNGLCKNSNSLDRRVGDLLPASYLNFYMINGAVLIPSFGCDTDETALNCFKEIFSNRQIIQIYSREPILGGGGIHCLLHEVPMH